MSCWFVRGVMHCRWCSLESRLSLEGYSGATVSYLEHTKSFYDMADELHRIISNNKFTPPVLVAHSVSTYAAQKYLESYALTGLILVNPVPPFSAQRFIANLQHRWHHIKDLTRSSMGESKESEHLGASSIPTGILCE